MKILVIPDVHGRDAWKKYVNVFLEEVDRIVFLGDYVDSYDVKDKTIISNLQDILQLKRDYPEKVILLVGNHDLSYWPGSLARCSGYRPKMHSLLFHLFSTDKDLFKILHAEEDLWFSHAGITEKFIEDQFTKDTSIDDIPELVNKLFIKNPNNFNFKGPDPYGDNINEGPLWVRPQSLILGTPQYMTEKIQIVGHTQLEVKTVSDRFFFTDEGSKSVLFIDTKNKNSKFNFISL